MAVLLWLAVTEAVVHFGAAEQQREWMLRLGLYGLVIGTIGYAWWRQARRKAWGNAMSEDVRLRLADSVVEHASEGIVVTDAQSRIVAINPAFSRLLGYEAQELMGRKPSVFKSGKHGPDFYQAMWAKIKSAGQWRGEIWNKRKNGEIFPERMSLSAVRDADGTVTHYVCMFTDISEEKRREQQLERLAHHDSLTGLANRHVVLETLEHWVQRAKATDEHMAVILLNLDRFKHINQSYGHAIGDRVIQHIARQVQAGMRQGDFIGRMAGDEMVVLARNVASPEEAAAIAERLIQRVSQPWQSPEGFAVVVSVSAGICCYPQHAQEASALLQGAHAAVYGAKNGQGDQGGRSPWCFYEESMTAAARERIEMEARLRRALREGHLQLYYQPQVRLRTGRIESCEALVRWIDPIEGMISPARFISVAENSGLIAPLGEWVLHEACRQAKAWQEAGLKPLVVAVNVSQRQFLLTDIAGCVQQVLQRTGWTAPCLELEITESALADRPEEARAVLDKLRAMQVRLAIDDFGTGYSSLAHLKRFPIDVLKIDQSFIRDLEHSADDKAITHAIMAMGQSMGLQVVAEGVETPAQLAFLREHGCDVYQGYLCSKPLPAGAFAALLRAQAGAHPIL
ncbi:MAG: putative bifunctional diguanylate cyclase/phosphodiesterase [Comamonas sp.]